MKGSEILKMVEDVLPKCMSVKSCKGIYKVEIHDEVMVGLKPGKYGVVDLRLMVRLDTPVRDTDDDVDRSRFEAMKEALEKRSRFEAMREAFLLSVC